MLLNPGGTVLWPKELPPHAMTGETRIVVELVPVPYRLLAIRLTGKSPSTIGTPTIVPVVGSICSPGGKPDASNQVGSFSTGGLYQNPLPSPAIVIGGTSKTGNGKLR